MSVLLVTHVKKNFGHRHVYFHFTNRKLNECEGRQRDHGEVRGEEERRGDGREGENCNSRTTGGAYY